MIKQQQKPELIKPITHGKN